MAGGQILFKLVANRSQGGLDFITSPIFLATLVVYGAATLSWVFTLRLWPLGVAYPATASAIAFVVSASVLLFGETISLVQWSAITMIIAGVLLLTLS